MAQLATSGKKIVVLGGGLSGLSFVHYLRNFSAGLNKNGLINKVTLLEANNYMGGSIKSSLFDDGMVHELGPRSIRTQGVRAQNTVALLEQLGLQDEVVKITSKMPAARNRYVYNNNQLLRLQLTMNKIFTRLPDSKLRIGGAIYKDLTTERIDLNKYPDRDPSIYDFMSHRFGEEAAEKVSDPIMRGITAGNVRNLSTRALLSDLLDKEQTYGSLLKGFFKPPVTKMAHDDLFPNDILESKLLDKFRDEDVVSYNLRTGLQTLPERLCNSLLNTNEDGLVSIYNSTKVVSIGFDDSDFGQPPCSVEVCTVDGDRVKIFADHIISTIPSTDLAKILPDTMPAEQRQALDDVIKIPHSPVGCVTVEYRDLDLRELPKALNSFGFLTHSKAGSRVLGISFDSAMFPVIDQPLNSTRMTCMIGGSWYKEILGTDNVDQVQNSQLEQIALEEIRKILGIKEEPHRMSTLFWKTGIAQYAPGHNVRLEKARADLKKLSIPLTLLGQSYDGIAVNDVIFCSRMAAYNFVKSL